MRRRTQVRPFAVLAGRLAVVASLISLSAGAQDALDLLRKVADRYREPKTFQAEAERTSTMTGRGSRSVSVSSFRSAYAAPGKYRILPIDGEFMPVERVSDGETVFWIQHDKKQYTKSPSRSGNVNHWAGEARFAKILDRLNSARIDGEEMVGRIPCVKITYEPKPIDPPDPRAINVKSATLWVDPSTGIVWKSQEQSEVSDPFVGSRSVETIYTYQSVSFDAEIPTSYFQVDLPEDYRQVENLSGAMVARPSVSLRGKPAPEFTLRDLKGTEVRLADLRGKTVLLNFWATWCQPCRAEMPFIELLHRSFASKGLVVLGIDGETVEVAAKYLDENRYTVRSLVDPGDEVRKRYGAEGVPTTYLIDAEGKVVEAHTGSMGNADLKAALERLGIW